MWVLMAQAKRTLGQLSYPWGLRLNTGGPCYEGVYMSNPRYANGNFRRKMRARFRAMDAECNICHGKLGRIRYEDPSDSDHPLSFVIDEIKPCSRWREFGYSSAKAACLDINNLAAAHYCCNQAKSNHLESDSRVIRIQKKISLDGDW